MVVAVVVKSGESLWVRQSMWVEDGCEEVDESESEWR
jgi:hypothetical protein